MSWRGQNCITFWNRGFPSRRISFLCKQGLLGMEHCHLFTAMTSAEKHILSPQARVFLVLQLGWGILAKPPTGLVLNCIRRYLQPLDLTEKEEKLNISRSLLKVQQSAETSWTYSVSAFFFPNSKFCFPKLNLAFTSIKSLQRAHLTACRKGITVWAETHQTWLHKDALTL